MLIRVVDNNTNTVLNQTNTNDWAQAMVHYIDGFRRKYNNAKVEWYYSETAEGHKPVSTYKTFH